MSGDVGINRLSEDEKARRRAYYRANKEKVHAQHRDYYLRNREKVKAASRKYKADHAEEDAARDREYYARNREKIIAQKREYYSRTQVQRAAWGKEYREKNSDVIKAKKHAYYLKNRDALLARGRRVRHALWEKARDFFGPCACCGEHRIEFLSLDHINGNGTAKRQSGERAGWGRLSEFNKAGWPDDLKVEYRILCHNCNQSIGYLGYCPHEFEHETSRTESEAARLPSKFDG